uniref:Uncharacterized protein n=1 Tax=Oryza barthii TaxID=65489 RepID=A0A0D3EXF7_9ORYZ
MAACKAFDQRSPLALRFVSCYVVVSKKFEQLKPCMIIDKIKVTFPAGLYDSAAMHKYNEIHLVRKQNNDE